LILKNWLPPNVSAQFSGTLNGHATVAMRKWKFGDGAYGGDVRLIDGELQYTSVQSMLARFLNQRSLLIVPLTQMQFSWKFDQANVNVSGIDMRAGNDLGVQGDFAIDGDKRLSGLLWVGTKPEYLKWLPGAEKDVFIRNDSGLVWAHVKLSGTTKKPGQDLSSQVVRQFTRHPLALVGLGFKAASWYVGNWFGAAKEWQRPPTPDVEVARTAGPARGR
jgi:hypothetical protein